MPDATIELDGLDQTPRHVYLEVVSGPYQGSSWIFDRMGDFIIGRDHPSHIRLTEEASLSQQHLRLTIEPSRIRLEDLQTTNGTWLNGIRISAANISDGDRFGVGDTLFSIYDQSRPPSHSPAKTEVTSVQSGKSDDRPKKASLRDSPNARITSGQENTRIAIAPTNQGVPSAAPDLAESPKPPTAFPTLSSEQIAAFDAVTETIAFSPPNSQQTTTIGAYEVIRPIGQGGMAIVYEVRHKRTDKRYAMKLIRHEGDVSEKQLSLFVREAGLILRLIHPRIVRAYEFGFHGSKPFLVMELLPIVDLGSLVDQQTLEQKTKTACWVISRILQALHFAHSENVVHRDVKIGNILAYRQGRHLQVKLGDFGLAKSFQDAGLSAMTNEQSIRGTLAYMPPEQLRNARSSGPLVDMYATGVCLYRLLTGMLPSASFKPNVFEQELQQLTGFPRGLVEVLRTSMQREPAKRYQSAEEMAYALYPFHGRP